LFVVEYICSEMAEVASILRIVFILALAWAYQVRAQGLYTGDATWSNAHATFYGGSDASGTQGIIAGFDQFVSCIFRMSLVKLKRILPSEV
jgi:hypothetical protein